MLKTSDLKEMGISTNYDNKIIVYVPAYGRDNPSVILSTSNLLCDLFGGSSRVEIKGVWRDEKDISITEFVTKIYSFFPDSEKEKIIQVVNFCKELRSILRQDCIGLEINNQFFFI